jgi:hypothetical protein
VFNVIAVIVNTHHNNEGADEMIIPTLSSIPLLLQIVEAACSTRFVKTFKPGCIKLS